MSDEGAAFWLRDPALSSDGTRIAFRCAGQIWAAPPSGGEALPLTPTGTYAGHPVWSPDGTTIAFASDRFGPLDVFAVPAAGGAARRLTFYERDQDPTGFTPDGAAVMFWSAQLGDVEPRDRWTRPPTVVMNAASYSDSPLFPLAYRDLHLGPLVGGPVAGTGTGTWWIGSRLIPGLDYGLPGLPLHGRDGALSENHAVEPDIPAPSDPTAWAEGRDPQLEAAVRAPMPCPGTCPMPQP